MGKKEKKKSPFVESCRILVDRSVGWSVGRPSLVDLVDYFSFILLSMSPFVESERHEVRVVFFFV